MFRRCMFIIGILLTILPSRAFCASGNVTMTRFGNGMKVIVREGHVVNLVAVDVWVKAGSANEDSSNSGVAHFCEHMVFRATKKYGPGEIDRELEGVGAEANGATSKDYIHLYTTRGERTSPDRPRRTGGCSDERPDPTGGSVKERQVVLDEIARTDSDPLKVAVNIFARTAYTTHPYMRTATGNREAVMRLKRDDLVSYYKQHFTPANTCVSIAGDVTNQAAVAAVRQAFAGFDKFTRTFRVETRNPPAEPVRTSPLIRRYAWKQSAKAYVVFGFLAAPGWRPGRKSAHWTRSSRYSATRTAGGSPRP